MPDEFEVRARAYQGIDFRRIASEELFKAAKRGQKAWRDNLLAGEGAEGLHGTHRTLGPVGTKYQYKGDAIGDVTMTPQEEGHLEYEVGGDIVQLLVAEFGRAPWSSPPPFDEIAEWAERKGLVPDEVREAKKARRRMSRADKEDAFRRMVDGIRFAIAERGLSGFAPGRKAGEETMHDLDARVQARIDAELERQRVT